MSPGIGEFQLGSEQLAELEEQYRATRCTASFSRQGTLDATGQFVPPPSDRTPGAGSQIAMYPHPDSGGAITTSTGTPSSPIPSEPQTITDIRTWLDELSRTFLSQFSHVNQYASILSKRDTILSQLGTSTSPDSVRQSILSFANDTRHILTEHINNKGNRPSRFGDYAAEMCSDYMQSVDSIADGLTDDDPPTFDWQEYHAIWKIHLEDAGLLFGRLTSALNSTGGTGLTPDQISQVVNSMSTLPAPTPIDRRRNYRAGIAAAFRSNSVDMSFAPPATGVQYPSTTEGITSGGEFTSRGTAASTHEYLTDTSGVWGPLVRGTVQGARRAARNRWDCSTAQVQQLSNAMSAGLSRFENWTLRGNEGMTLKKKKNTTRVNSTSAASSGPFSGPGTSTPSAPVTPLRSALGNRTTSTAAPTGGHGPVVPVPPLRTGGVATPAVSWAPPGTAISVGA